MSISSSSSSPSAIGLNSIKIRQKHVCIVPTCKGEKFSAVHKFPMENERALQWLNALNIKKSNNIRFDELRKKYVCSRHFRKQDYKNSLSHRLNNTAVPNINLKSLNQLHLCNPNLIKISTLEQVNVDNNDDVNVNLMNENNTNLKRPNDDFDILFKNGLDDDQVLSCTKNQKLSSSTSPNFLNENNYEVHYEIEENKNSDIDDNYWISIITEDENYSSDKFSEENIKVKQNKSNIPLQTYSKKSTGIIKKDKTPNIDDYWISMVTEDENCVEYISTDKLNEENIKIKRNNSNVPVQTYSKKSTGIITMASKFLKISYPKYSETLSIDYFWLRDHCRCSSCFNYNTNQRKYSLLDISIDTRPSLTECKDDKLFVTWDDGHKSQYCFNFLFQTQFEYVKKNYVLTKQILWDKKKIQTEDFARVDLGQLVVDDNLINKLLKSLIVYGVAFIENVPANQDMTEMAIRRLFEIQKTFFGEMWIFGDQESKNHLDTAYTKNYLEVHTDTTYFCDSAGLQIFHCLEHKNGNGGETFLVDGFKVIQDLMIQNYDAYQKLVEINLPCEYIEDGQHHVYSAPVIRLNSDTKKPEQIRFNLYDRAVLNTLPQEETHEYYEYLRYFTKLLTMKDNKWEFKLNPGTMLIFDNWRILHGRHSYTGKRRMCGSYISRTEFLSKARLHNLIR